MRKIDIKNMSTEEIKKMYVDIAIEQNRAIIDLKSTKYNKLFDIMEELESELRGRPGDERRALIPLLDSPSAQVRFCAAVATLALTPDAKDTLIFLCSLGYESQAIEARNILRAIEEGRYVPT